MHIKVKQFVRGYNEVCTPSDISCMDVGKIYLQKGDSYHCQFTSLERAFLLVKGHVVFTWEGNTSEAKRLSCFDENPICLHVPTGLDVKIDSKEESEIIFEGIENKNVFEPKLFSQEDCISEQFGKDVLSNTSIRVVRTIIDDSIAPYSNLVLGEVINLPGKWSSYPPHHHMQPEVYMYRFLPEQGFGFSCEGEQVYKVRSGDSVVLEGGKVHPQVSAPGYAMYYAWLIPHTPKRWLKDRNFLDQDLWLLDEHPYIWEPDL